MSSLTNYNELLSGFRLKQSERKHFKSLFFVDLFYSKAKSRCQSLDEVVNIFEFSFMRTCIVNRSIFCLNHLFLNHSYILTFLLNNLLICISQLCCWLDYEMLKLWNMFWKWFWIFYCIHVSQIFYLILLKYNRTLTFKITTFWQFTKSKEKRNILILYKLP